MNDKFFNDKINMDDLYTQRKKTEEHKIKIYQKILARVHKKIKTIARSRNNKRFCFFLLPEFVLGIPRYDIATCTSYIIAKLMENGFLVKYTYPNLLFISWRHYIPNYERTQIKKKTGISIDGFGNVVKNKNKKQNHDTSNMNNLLLQYKHKDIAVKKKEEDSKKYTAITTYKPTGNLIYNTKLLRKIENTIQQKKI
tara:strand:+ start:1484 stop:2074 length:591 start_codon:yes stop_codon:yes gene_type:complete